LSNRKRTIVWSIGVLFLLLTAVQWQSGSLAFWESPVVAQTPNGSTTPAATNPDATNNSQGAGILDIVLSGGIVGMMILLLLFALSLTAAYLVFEHAMTIRHKDLMPEGLRDNVRDHLLAGNVEDAENACKASPSFLSFVILSGIAELDSVWTGVEKALEDATAEQSARLFRKIEYLSVIGNIAPMVGLLGTVTGMIFAFQQVASTQGAAGAADLAEGIYQALVTTVGGLIIAIPCLGAFAVFRNWIDELVAEAAYQAQQVFTPLKRRRRQASATGGKSG
jgi:biopolymer transport protein ExbB